MSYRTSWLTCVFVAAATLLPALGMTTAYAQVVPSPATMTGDTPIYEKTDKKSAKLAELKAGDSVRFLAAAAKKWASVEAGGKTGFVPIRLLMRTFPVPGEITKATVALDAASGGKETALKFVAGDRVEILADTEAMAEVKNAAGQGWVATGTVKHQPEPPKPVQKPEEAAGESRPVFDKTERKVVVLNTLEMNIPEKLSKRVRDIFERDLAPAGYRVFSGDNLMRLYSEKTIEKAKDCGLKLPCLAEIAAESGATYFAIASVAKVGSGYHVGLRLAETKTATLQGRSDGVVQGDEAAFIAELAQKCRAVLTQAGLGAGANNTP